ncbi:MAG TPA: hypothetical protein VNS79_07030 [Sphingobium sp.]|nr:hypothetical protein [Sphingobium sp.]
MTRTNKGAPARAGLGPVAAVSLLALLALAGCQAVPRVEPPAPAPVPAPPPPPAPPPVVPDQSWEEAPAAPGDWSYGPSGGDSIARFGVAGRAPLLTMRCAAATRRITLQGAGLGTGSALTIRTSYGALQWAADAQVAGAALSVTRPASDPGFDWIAYSRGRISLETAGAPRLIVPVWAELVRVIEDCRG